MVISEMHSKMKIIWPHEATLNKSPIIMVFLNLLPWKLVMKLYVYV